MIGVTEGPVTERNDSGEMEVQIPGVLAESVERSIVKGSHQRSLYRPTSPQNAERPVLGLSGAQMVTKRLPLQGQLLFGRRFGDGDSAGMHLSVANERSEQHQSVAVIGLISILQMNHRIRSRNEPALQQSLSRHHVQMQVGIFQRCSHAYLNGAVGERGRRLQQVQRLALGWLGVGQRHDGKLLLKHHHRVGSLRRHYPKPVFTGRQ